MTLGSTDTPPAHPGQRIGLFGGSFNPAHDGHRLVALECLKRLQLDCVWLLVSPGNPLKDHAELAPLDERVTKTRALMNHPKLIVTGLEEVHGLHFTADTLSFLHHSHKATRFVWIMGADNLLTFDHWERWQTIAELMPIAVYARPGTGNLATRSPAAITLERFRIPEAAAETLAEREPPSWVYLHGATSPLSSTAIRQEQATHK